MVFTACCFRVATWPTNRPRSDPRTQAVVSSTGGENSLHGFTLADAAETGLKCKVTSYSYELETELLHLPSFSSSLVIFDGGSPSPGDPFYAVLVKSENLLVVH